MLERMTKRMVSFDAFPKVQRNIQNATNEGGLVTLLLAIFLAWIVAGEVAEYRTIRQLYEFVVDTERNNELQLNVDITIAMPCNHLRADVLDLTGTSLSVSNSLRSEPVSFAISDAVRRIEKESIRKLIVQAQQRNDKVDRGKENLDGDACRVTGELKVSKLAGMLHFTALGHGYVGQQHTPHNLMNFTHRIDKLSFGPYYPGLLNPLDRTLEVTSDPLEMFQYHISVVPTTYIDGTRILAPRILTTSQFAVTDYAKTVATGGIPGIFFKYDIEALSVRIVESRQSFLHFITRFCGIIGGIVVTMGIALSVLRLLRRLVIK